MTEKSTVMKTTGLMQDEQERGHAEPFIMRKIINSTAYEVVVHFSQTNRETLKDKVLRMIKNEVRQ